MKIEIDISVFIEPTGSYGVINGSMELDYIPRIGEEISFLLPLKEEVMPLGEEWFNGILKVEHILYIPTENDTKVMAVLESITLASKEDGIILSKYVSAAFGLYLDDHL